MIGKSAALLSIQRTIAKIAPRDRAVLIVGESGTGKELVARAIHNASGRTPFIPVDCGSLPATLVESELFGYAPGAFTGAARPKSGLFQAAHGGTLFLDEVGELPLELQPKLLRALQEREVRPIGATKAAAVDVRVIAATHRGLKAEVAAGHFRKDLYFRLSVLTLTVPPLRDRPEDIAELAQHFAARSGGLGYDAMILPEVMDALRRYDWPGNVRELENAIERAVALNTNGPIRREDLPSSVLATLVLSRTHSKNPFSLEQMERHAIEHALAKTNNSKIEAARLLGIGKTTLYRKLREYALEGDEGNSKP